MISFHKAMVRDLPAIWQLELRGYEYPLEHKYLEETIEGSGSAPLVGRVGNQVVLWCICVKSPESKDLILSRLAVHPAMRRHGFGKKCVNYICDSVKKQGPGKLLLVVPEYQMVHDDPDTVNEFVWKCGFKAVRTVKDAFNYYGRLYDGIQLERAF